MSYSLGDILSDPPDGLEALLWLIGEDLRKLVKRYLVALDPHVDVEDTVRRLAITLHWRLLQLTDRELDAILRSGGVDAGSRDGDPLDALRRWLIIVATKMLATAAAALRRHPPSPPASGRHRPGPAASPAAAAPPAPPSTPSGGAAEIVEGTIDGVMYRVRKYGRPAESVSGDCVVVSDGPAADGVVWVIIGDVTSHGWPAWLLAAGLPDLWQLCLEEDSPGTPTELLDAIDRRLEVCLPMGISVETTAARLCPSGEVLIAGGGPVIFRDHSEATLSVRRLGGPYLGWSPLILPKIWREGAAVPPWQQSRWRPDEDDEILFASDGLFDQGFQGPIQRLLQAVPLPRRKRSMFDLLTASLNGAAFVPPQKDDLTFVSIQLISRGDGYS